MDLNDQLARTALTLLNQRYVEPYLSIFGIDATGYAQNQLISYSALSQVNPFDATGYKISYLYAFKVEAESILTGGHSSKLALEHNDPGYTLGIYADKYIAKYMDAATTVDWLTPNLNPADRSTLIAKFAAGSIDGKTMIASIGLLLAKGQALSLTNILSTRESLYGDNVTLEQTSRISMPDTVGTDRIDTLKLNSASFVYIKDYSAEDHTFTFTQAQDRKSTKLVSIERVEFSDHSRLALDIEGNAGQTYRLYKAAFDRVPDKEGLGFWITQMDNGTSLEAVAEGFVSSQEFKSINGASPSSLNLVTSLYNHVLGRAPDQEGLNFWKTLLDNQSISTGELLISMSESNENKIALLGQMQFGIEYVV